MVAEAFYPDPQKLYDPDPLLKPNVITEYGAFPSGASLGIACYALYNYLRRRPIFSSLPVYAVLTLGFGGFFYGVNKAYRAYYSRRDTIFKHYVQLHPEDFPPPPKKKIGELFEDWNPVR